jgi:hypothetical protein
MCYQSALILSHSIQSLTYTLLLKRALIAFTHISGVHTKEPTTLSQVTEVNLRQDSLRIVLQYT